MKTKKENGSRTSQQQEEANLKQMLEFYRQRRKIEAGDHQSALKQISEESEPVQTESIMLPYNDNHFMLFPRNSNIIIKSQEEQEQMMRQTFLQTDFRRKIEMRKIFSRQNLSEMNKRHRNLRNFQYKQNKMPEQISSARYFNDHNAKIDDHKFKIENPTESVVDLSRNITRKAIYTSVQKRRIIIDKNRVKTKQGSKTERSVKTAFDRRNLINQNNENKSYMNEEEVQQYIKQRKINPLVVYPFQTKLKSKRIDDNPKVLGSIIKKKYNSSLDKQDLYEYINNLMKRKNK